MLTRKPASRNEDRGWFMFSAGLMHSLCSDYIATRMLYRLEPLTTAFTIVPKMLDVVEKSLKLHLAVRTETPTALSSARSQYGHNIEKLRADCASYDRTFDDPDIRRFTKDLNDNDGKLYQHLRYGSQETTAGITADLAALMPIGDKIFFKSILLLPEDARRLLVFPSILKSLVTGSRFDQTRHRPQVLELLMADNVTLPEFIAYCEQLDVDHRKLLAQTKG